MVSRKFVNITPNNKEKWCSSPKKADKSKLMEQGNFTSHICYKNILFYNKKLIIYYTDYLLLLSTHFCSFCCWYHYIWWILFRKNSDHWIFNTIHKHWLYLKTKKITRLILAMVYTSVTQPVASINTANNNSPPNDVGTQ